MSTSTVEIALPLAREVAVTKDSIRVDLSDGRTILVPLAWFPRLLNASAQERNRWRLIGSGRGIHWTELGEDISVEGLLAGRPSGESQASFAKWLKGRNPIVSRSSARRAGGRS